MITALPKKKPPTTDRQVCPNLGRYGLVNKDTGEIVQLPCNRYSCPCCGKRKAFKLQKALELKFGCFDYVRLFTFTFRTTIFANPHHAIINASEIWRRFINNVRRDSRLNMKLRQFQYVRLIEFTKRDYPHYHVLVDRYLPRQILQEHWEKAINTVMFQRGYNGTVNAIGMKTAKAGARYVVKYVLKSAQSFDKTIGKYFGYKRCKLKLYTKSGDMKLFYPSSSLWDWEFIILDSAGASGNLIYKDNAQLPENFSTFTDFLDPPPEIMAITSQNGSYDHKYYEIEIENYLNYLNLN